MIEFHPLIKRNHPNYYKHDAEIMLIIPRGYNRRFAVYEVRIVGEEGGKKFWDWKYVVRDAEALSDADAQAGYRPPVVYSNPSLNAAIQFIHNNYQSNFSA